jgi:hypothetical protein
MSDLVNRLRWAATLGDLTTTSARNLMEEAAARIAELEAALRQICDGPRDADKSYAELFAEVCWEARAALEGGKKDE